MDKHKDTNQHENGTKGFDNSREKADASDNGFERTSETDGYTMGKEHRDDEHENGCLKQKKMMNPARMHTLLIIMGKTNYGK